MKQELKALLPSLRRFAFSLTGNLADADDLVQNTIERVLNRGAPAHGELTAWTFKVCRNLWIDEYRAQKVRQQATTKPELQSAQIVDDTIRITAEISLAEVRSAMAQLNDEHRTVLSLVAVQGLSYSETASILDIPAGTVMSRLARARSKLVDLLNLDGTGATA